ncbi:MAG: hypothetical protein K2Y12_12305 [Chitinophagaceae bacterium]|nr:hypothetical protein [Chitinophagaceae bacterium]
MKLELIRTYYPDGVNGELLIDGVKVCNTIELPWKENQSRVSCIPEGKYELTKRYSQRFKWHLLLNNVVNRSYILIHAFNDAVKESKGCIAPVFVLTGNGKGIRSRAALQLLLSIVYPELENGKQIFITIKKAANGNKPK